MIEKTRRRKAGKDFAPQHIRFESPLKPDECAARLRDLKTHPFRHIRCLPHIQHLRGERYTVEIDAAYQSAGSIEWQIASTFSGTIEPDRIYGGAVIEGQSRLTWGVGCLVLLATPILLSMSAVFVYGFLRQPNLIGLIVMLGLLMFLWFCLIYEVRRVQKSQRQLLYTIAETIESVNPYDQ